jgi:hypothetical protein
MPGEPLDFGSRFPAYDRRLEPDTDISRDIHASNNSKAIANLKDSSHFRNSKLSFNKGVTLGKIFQPNLRIGFLAGILSKNSTRALKNAQSRSG